MDSKDKEVVLVTRGSVELVVIGLLAALVVLLAFPLLSGIDKKEHRNIEQNQDVETSEALFPID